MAHPANSRDRLSAASSSSSDQALSSASSEASPDQSTPPESNADQNTSSSISHRRPSIKSPAASTAGILRFSTPVRSGQSIPRSPSTAGSSRSSTHESNHEQVSPRSSFAPNYQSKSARSLTLSFPTHKRLASTVSVSTFRKPYRSTKLNGEIAKPWIMYPDPAHRWAKAIFWGLFALSFAIGAAVVYLGIRSIPSVGKLCLVMNDDFSNGINADFWSHEVRLDGYGNGQFEWTTQSSNNSFVEDETLYIVPTLTSDTLGAAAITDGYSLNLTTDGTCTSTNITQCAAISNSSTGSIINPVQSARLSTRGKVSVKYGKVEVTARMPIGDWLWPAIWMLPEDSVYGEWPRSGEIDIAESRGNNLTYPQGGYDRIQSTLHWGPNSGFDSYWRTYGFRRSKTQGYQEGFHKFTLEWNEKYISIYVDNRVYAVYDLKFDETFWKRGAYPTYYQNGSQTLPLTNPWYTSSNNAAPFDQSFYLVLDVAVGGTNGYFPDNEGSKPWLDSSLSAMKDFWTAKNTWYPTWATDPKKRGLAVSNVKVWQKC